ncbi:HlyD family secretion protein [Burkholderia cenocepacia]|uniref:HlyD family secretion protein n=1 Tax=Burkholderia cenocepacia TaxID=95486 RepID=UPI002AB66760|nr:HlyD family efflux transporter periplasmic adaptor subunit [Burkholderia cenocepacia]
MNSLFRREAQEANRTSLLGGIVLVRPISFTFLTGVAASMAAGVVLLFMVGGYTQRATVDGLIVPEAGLVKIYARQSGVVLRKNIVEGQHVEKGMVLYTVSTELRSATEGGTQAALIDQSNRRKRSLLEEMNKTKTLQKDESATLRTKLASLRVDLDGIDIQLSHQKERATIAADGVARYRRLLDQDYISTDQLQQRETDLIDQKSRLVSLKRDRVNISQQIREAEIDLANILLKHQNQLSQIGRSVIDVEQALIEAEARREFVITAPETGIATAVIPEPGQSVDTVHPIAGIVPDGTRWQANLFVPSAAVGFIHVGDPVRLRFQAFPYQKFGQYTARVKSIARAALSPAELSETGISTISARSEAGGFYRVIATLDAQSVTVYGRPQSLQTGMTLQADILRERRRLYEWVLDPLYSFTGKL